jgi:hypothetical protein
VPECGRRHGVEAGVERADHRNVLREYGGGGGAIGVDERGALEEADGREKKKTCLMRTKRPANESSPPLPILELSGG